MRVESPDDDPPLSTRDGGWRAPDDPRAGVLQLTPKRRDYVHTLLAGSTGWHDVRFEGRFLFPTEGDGYLG